MEVTVKCECGYCTTYNMPRDGIVVCRCGRRTAVTNVKPPAYLGDRLMVCEQCRELGIKPYPRTAYEVNVCTGAGCPWKPKAPSPYVWPNLNPATSLNLTTVKAGEHPLSITSKDGHVVYHLSPDQIMMLLHQCIMCTWSYYKLVPRE